MDQTGPSRGRQSGRNVFRIFENDDDSGDEDFNIEGLNVEEQSDSSDESDSEVSVASASTSRTECGPEWIPVEVPEPENAANDPGFTLRNTESVQNIPGESFCFLSLDLGI